MTTSARHRTLFGDAFTIEIRWLDERRNAYRILMLATSARRIDFRAR